MHAKLGKSALTVCLNAGIAIDSIQTWSSVLQEHVGQPKIQAHQRHPANEWRYHLQNGLVAI